MDRIGVVGTSYRTTSMDELGAAALPAEFSNENLRELARLAGFSELVYLGTCNRVEFYFSGESRIHTNPLLFHLRRSLADLTDGMCQLPVDDNLYVHHGRSAARHLFRVTSALDSMMVGEAQIAGQTKEAHERAHQAELLGGVLDQTFHEAFHLAKRIRTETELARRPVSLVTLVERMLHDHLAASSAPVMIVGAGEMARQALRLIRSGDPRRRVIIANRNSERAEEVAAADPAAGALPLDSVLLDPPRVGVVVAATASEEVLIGRDQLSAIRRQLPPDEGLLAIDLAMPANIDPAAGELDGVVVHGIEAMRAEAERNRQLRLSEIDRCEALVEHQLLILRRRLLDRALSPAARSMHRAFKELGERAVQHALSKELRHLDEADQKSVERLTRGLVKRLVQVPLRGLKGAAWHHSSAVLDNFIRGIEEDFVPEELETSVRDSKGSPRERTGTGD